VTPLEHFRASRETWATIEGFEFQLRRPTERQLARWVRDGDEALVAKAVVGWRKVKELDIWPGGTEQAAAFDAELLVEWAGDRPKIWEGLCTEILRLVSEHARRAEDQAKN